MNKSEFNEFEFRRLFKQQHERHVERWYRVFGVAVGSVLIYLYTGWLSSFVWAAAFICLNYVHYFYTKMRLQHVRAFDVYVQMALSHVGLVIFMSMPIYMFISSDELLKVVGGVVLMSLLIYLLHLGDRQKPMLIGQITIIAIGFFTILLAKSPLYSGWLEWVGLGFAFTILVSFHGYALFSARRRRLDMEAAAARLVQAQKMQAAGHVSGGIAHHFNNLLAVISGNLELMEDAKCNQDAEALRKNAQTAVQNGKKLVDLLLQFTHQDDTGAQPTPTPELMQKISDLEPHILSDTITFKPQDDPPDHLVKVDRDLFLTAMLHLVSNAADAIQDIGTIEIKASVVENDDGLTTALGVPLRPGRYVAFTVRDTGRGIPPQHLSRVAEPFFTTKPVGQGAGLGLAMVAGFAHRHGGGLLIDSGSDGTAVSLLLPAQ